MSLCAAINPSSNENHIQYYQYPPLGEIHNMYRTTLQNVLNTDINHCIPLVQRLARSFTVEDIIPMPNLRKTYSRTNSLFVGHFYTKIPSKQSNQVISKDFCFTAAENELDFKSIPEEDDTRYYSTKTPYKSPSKDYILSSPPTGYKPICVQLLARHGSRTLTKHGYDCLTIQIWQLAKQKNMLTSLGEELKNDTELFIKANNHVGLGEITQLGRDEHFGMGTRLFHRLKSLFIPSNTITVMTSGKKRAIDSAHEFLNGLTKSQCDIQISTENPNKKLLYFHKLCKDYMAFKNNDPHVKTKFNLIKNLEQTRIYSRQVLRRIYKEEFVQLLINQNYEMQSFENTDPMIKQTTNNEVDIALSLYEMFSVALAQSEPYVSKMLEKYFNREESNWFAYISDAQDFYLKGPSFEGTTITYAMAKPLLADFFSSINKCIEQPNSTAAAYLRFAHAETVIPFATLLQIPGLAEKAADHMDIYTYENNSWRGEKVSPMSTNIQWEIYRHEDDHTQILVRMLYNEREVRFKRDCQSITPDSFFYNLNELKRAYENVLLPSNSEAS